MVKQRAPKSIRLTEQDEEQSQMLAGTLGLTWHGWMTRLIRWANEQPPKKIRKIADYEDQERCS
jgi:hypothetical protein